MAVAVLGLLSFLSTFVSFAMNFGRLHRLRVARPLDGDAGVRRMILIIAGAVVSTIGRMGAAGAGLIPDPQRQRQDLEPWARAAGGMVNDALSEVDAFQSRPADGTAIIKVRCPACKALNDEQDKFCGQCGGRLT
jgi:hypothetical protein